MQTVKRIKWIMDCLINSYFEKLTEWEEDFVIKTELYLKDHASLTEAHYDKLEDVYSRVQQRR
jgi:hypothetical protein